jgi:hypothetical protein
MFDKGYFDELDSMIWHHEIEKSVMATQVGGDFEIVVKAFYPNAFLDRLVMRNCYNQNAPEYRIASGGDFFIGNGGHDPRDAWESACNCIINTYKENALFKRRFAQLIEPFVPKE